MQRKEKTVITKDGYTITKHSFTLLKNRFYSIEKDGVLKGWYRYGELYNSLKLLRLIEVKNIHLIVHSDRELVLVQAILSECKLVKAYSDEYAINKINGMLCACYMLDMLYEPLIIITLDDVIELRMILHFCLNVYNQYKSIANKL